MVKMKRSLNVFLISSNVKLCFPLVAILDREQNNILREQDNMLWEENNILREQYDLLHKALFYCFSIGQKQYT